MLRKHESVMAFDSLSFVSISASDSTAADLTELASEAAEAAEASEADEVAAAAPSEMSTLAFSCSPAFSSLSCLKSENRGALELESVYLRSHPMQS
jgi:hypothetical protein